MNCGTPLIARAVLPIGRVMMRPVGECEHGNVMEVHGLSRVGRDVMVPQLYRVLAASGCWLVGFKRGTRRVFEYSFEIELNRALDLYCGLVQAGLEMTELSHRTLTELCVLRTHNRTLSGPPRVVSLRLVMSFVEVEEEAEVRLATSASA